MTKNWGYTQTYKHQKIDLIKIEINNFPNMTSSDVEVCFIWGFLKTLLLFFSLSSERPIFHKISSYEPCFKAHRNVVFYISLKKISLFKKFKNTVYDDRQISFVIFSIFQIILNASKEIVRAGRMCCCLKETSSLFLQKFLEEIGRNNYLPNFLVI